MRRSYDEPADDGLDEPVTLTGRQLRSLNRGATFGFIALILALVAAGAAGYTTFRVMTQAPVTTSAAPAAATEGGLATAPTATTDSVASATEAAAPTVTEAAAPAPAVHKISATPKAAKTEVAVVKSSKRTRAATAATSKPVTESFDPGPAAPAGVAPSPVPMPVSADSAH